METTVIAQGLVDASVGRLSVGLLLPCPCCGAPASVGFKRNASLGLHGWVSDCTICTDSASFHRFTRAAAVESWNNYAAQPALPNAIALEIAREIEADTPVCVFSAHKARELRINWRGA